MRNLLISSRFQTNTSTFKLLKFSFIFWRHKKKRKISYVLRISNKHASKFIHIFYLLSYIDSIKFYNFLNKIFFYHFIWNMELFNQFLSDCVCAVKFQKDEEKKSNDVIFQSWNWREKIKDTTFKIVILNGKDISLRRVEMGLNEVFCQKCLTNLKSHVFSGHTKFFGFRVVLSVLEAVVILPWY